MFAPVCVLMWTTHTVRCLVMIAPVLGLKSTYHTIRYLVMFAPVLGLKSTYRTVSSNACPSVWTLGALVTL